MVTGGRIGYSKTATVAKGTLVLAAWRPEVSVPGRASLEQSLAPIASEVWDLSYFPLPHVGITLSKDITEYELQWDIAVANGRKAAHGLMWYKGIENAIALDELGADAKKAVVDFATNTVEAIGDAAGSALWFARYGLWLILGIVLLAIIIVVVFAVRKKKS
jgi:hypothetical protein